MFRIRGYILYLVIQTGRFLSKDNPDKNSCLSSYENYNFISGNKTKQMTQRDLSGRLASFLYSDGRFDVRVCQRYHGDLRSYLDSVSALAASDVVSVLFCCCSTVCDAGPTAKYH